MKLPIAVVMGAYAVLALLAGLTLSEPRFRFAVWILLGGLALKTWIAHAAKW